MSFRYTDNANRFFALEQKNVLNRFIVDGTEYLRLSAPGEFSFYLGILKNLNELYKADEEKGGLILFEVVENNGKKVFLAKEVIPITNATVKDKRTSYSPDPKELNDAYIKTLSSSLIPIAFHTHPTIYWDNQDIMMQGINFLQQLNTSIQDQASTLWCFTTVSDRYEVNTRIKWCKVYRLIQHTCTFVIHLLDNLS